MSETSARVVDRDAAADRCRTWRDEGLTVVFTNGVFDILHPGHAGYLEEAGALGDRLVVGVNDDLSAQRLEKGPARPVNPLRDRAWMLASLRSVDLVVPFSEDTPLQLIEALRPDVLVKGGDYRREEVVGGDEVESWGGRTVLIPLREGYSTTRLVERIRDGG
ncbi:MAG: D-glycero-beta-D-manno-heptose 1-phosphate adenylyltransferase [bacterium]